VQAEPSLHDAVLLADWQPVISLHVSVVQGFLSSQSLGPPGVHTPALQVSPMVQLLLSLQGAALPVCVQPFSLSQLLSVQGLPSSQAMAAPDLHAPAVQVSPKVQTLASSHGNVLLL
jgi:hypothetical protein